MSTAPRNRRRSPFLKPRVSMSSSDARTWYRFDMVRRKAGRKRAVFGYWRGREGCGLYPKPIRTAGYVGSILTLDLRGALGTWGASSPCPLQKRRILLPGHSSASGEGIQRSGPHVPEARGYNPLSRIARATGEFELAILERAG